MLYSHNKAYPAPLPPEITTLNADGEPWLFRPLPNDPQFLLTLGFVAVPEQPEFDPRSHKLDWSGVEWVIAGLDDETLVRNLALAKAELSLRLADLRWSKQQSFTYNDGEALADDVTIGRVVAKIFAAQLASTPPETTSLWKFGPNNFKEVTVGDLALYGAAINAHVQGCFDREAELVAMINAVENVTNLAAIDITGGWPE